MIKELFFCVALIAASGAVANAGESVLPPTPVGGTDISQAILPPTGLYGGMGVLPFDRTQQFRGFDRKPVPAASNLELPHDEVIAAGLLYVYPFQVFGGSLASSIQAAFYHICYDVGRDASRGCVGGLADTYSDIFYWSKNVGLAGVSPGTLQLPYGLYVAGGLAMKAPTGVYHTDNFINPGANLWLAIPNLAATYTTGPNCSLGDSTEISGRLFFGVPFQNPTSLYTSGNVIDVDWSVTQLFGNLRVGVAGYIETQVSNDTANGVQVPHGGKFMGASIGPVLEYIFPESGVAIKAKYLRTFDARNNIDLQFLALGIAMKLY
jgi:hypothetical protein